MIPFTQPFGQQLTAGDSWSWLVTLADYSAADGWVLTYYFHGAKHLDIASVASGNDFQLDATALQTKALPAGDYGWMARVAKGSQVITLARGTVELLPDISLQGDGFDARSQVKRTLDAINANLEGTAGRSELEYAVGGRMLKLRTFSELLQLQSEYLALYKRELKDNGQVSSQSNQVQVRFA